MANSISGNAGVAGATVSYTGVTFTQLAADTFNRADENPLNPANWTVPTPTGLLPLKVVNLACEPGITSGLYATEFYTGVDFTASANVYGEFELVTAPNPDDSTHFAIDLRSNSINTNVYDCGIFISGVYCQLYGPGATVVYSDSTHFVAGDKFRYAIFGSTHLFFRNAVLLGTATNATLATAGFVGLDAYSSSAIVRVKNFKAGTVGSISISGSVTADGAGNYTIPALATGFYIITPSLLGYLFTPTNRTVDLGSADVTGADFTAITVASPYAAIAHEIPTKINSVAQTVATNLVFGFPSLGSDFSAVFQVVGTVASLTSSLEVSLNGGITWSELIAAVNFLTAAVTKVLVPGLTGGVLYRIHATVLTGSQDFWVCAN